MKRGVVLTVLLALTVVGIFTTQSQVGAAEPGGIPKILMFSQPG